MDDAPVIEQATLEDLPQLVDLLHELFTFEGDFVPNRGKQMRGLRLILEQPNRGRIFVPINYSKGEPQRDFTDYMAAGFYSDDHGKTFHIADDIGIAGSNEATAAETSNGDILFNARNQRGVQKYRITARSSDGGKSWIDAGFDENLPDPVCQGSLLHLKGKVIAFVNNADQKDRNNLTLRISYDNGKTWKKRILIEGVNDPKGRDVTAYSDIVQVNSRTIGVLYERDDYKQIVFKAVVFARE